MNIIIKFKIIKYPIALFLLLFFHDMAYSQNKKLTWKELREEFKCPKWFSEARFGIWVHWGAQTQPEFGGGWYARHMYQKDVGSQTFGKNAPNLDKLS